MNNHKNKVWIVSAAVVFVIVAVATAILLVKVAGLDMLPMKYLGTGIFVVVLLLLLIFAFFFLLPVKKKDTEDAAEEQSTEKNVGKYILRIIAMLLAISMVVVDVIGIQMVNEFEETMSEVIEDETENQMVNKEDEVVKIEEYVFGVFVRADDKAEGLEDIKRYDVGYSLTYDGANTKQSINMIENELDRKLDLEEYVTIFDMVDQVLDGKKDAFILSTAYMDILEDQEEYADIADKVKCIYQCTVTTETNIPEKEEVAFDITKDTFVVYISGHDTTFATTRANSDVNILGVVNPVTKQVLLINTPRDSYISNTASPDGAMDKLTHCGTYGVECSMETLGELYDIDVNYYAQLNFNGFIRLIDAVGGISVYSEAHIETHDGYTFVKGTNYLNGDQALRFVRERKLYAGGDRVRGKHQMEVIKGLVAKMSSGALLKNYSGILNSMGKYFRCNVTKEELASLVKMQLGDMAEWNIQMYAVNGTGGNEKTYSLPSMSVYVLMIDQATVDHAKTLIDMVYDGEIIEAEDLVLPTESQKN